MLGICAATVIAGLPFLTRPLSPDEGGFLLVSSQWQPGSSLYGDYWVDRPPVLIGIFDLVDHLAGASGTTVTLRLVGLVATVATVLLAAFLGRVATQAPTRWQVLAPAAIAAVFLSTPLFGVLEVNGERLAVPFVLAGLAAVVLSLRAETARSMLLLAGVAGAFGVWAAMVKQNFVDVFVFVLAIGLHHVCTRRPRAFGWLLGVISGAATALIATLTWAWAHGTSPTGLWDAIVVFRFDAAAVISSSAVASTTQRFHGLVIAALVSGAPWVAAAAVWGLRGSATRAARTPAGQPVDVRWPALVVLGWEIVAVGMGGSYWLHYLVGLIPGLVLLSVAAGQRGASRTGPARLALSFAVVMAVVSLLPVALRPVADPDAAVVDYLQDSSVPGDTVVVGFGDPAIVWRSGLTSPYSELWSLPVRVRDSDLSDLSQVLVSTHRPTWVVVAGTDLATWGVHATTAQADLEQSYHEVATFEDLHVFHLG